MKKYVTAAHRPRLDGDYYEANASDFLARTVHEQEQEARDTGLLDAHGVRIYSFEEKPIGFIHHGESL